MGRQQVHLSEGTYDTSRGKQRGGLGNTGMLQIDNRGTMQHHVSEQELRNNKRALLSSKNNVAKRESAKVHEKLRNVVDNANAGVQNGANGEPTMKLSNGVRHLANHVRNDAQEADLNWVAMVMAETHVERGRARGGYASSSTYTDGLTGPSSPSLRARPSHTHVPS